MNMKMASGGYVIVLYLIMLVSTISAQSTLKCWRCSTDVSNGEFCNDPFEPDYISDQQRYWSYVNCTYSVGVKSINARPVCKKLVQEVYGKRVISRSCFYEDLDDSSDKCSRETTSPNIKTIHCMTCTTDGCNSGSGLVPYAYLTMFVILLLGLNQ